MSQYPYFHFPIVTIEQAHVLLRDDYSDSAIQDGFTQWADTYAERASRFYDAQYQLHADLLYGEFCRLHNLDSRIAVTEYDVDYTQELNDYAAEHGLADHHARLDQAQIFTPGIRDLGLDDFIEVNAAPNGMISTIWAFWFEQATRVDITEQWKLKRLRYADYITSDYWQRTRAAVLLARNLECSRDGCNAYDRLMGNLKSLHVHHLHYQNRGHEQLDNLILLCPECHQATHDGKALVFNIEMDE